MGMELDLGEAADVPGGDEIGSSGVKVVHFALAQLFRGIWMFDIVAAGGATANFPFGGFEEFEAGH